jgi:hypothetical protein
MGWAFYDSSGRKLNTASTLIDNLDIDGATDIGAAIVDADLFIVDDGAGGTNRKTAASRIKTYAGTTQAVQSDIEAETNQDTYVPPDLIKHSPGVAKVWCQFEQDSAHGIIASYNMTSMTDGGGVGDSDALWATDFSGNAVYTIVTSSMGSTTYLSPNPATLVAGGCSLLTFKHDGVAQDVNGGFACFGDQ